MNCDKDTGNILVIEDDVILGQVLGQVLTRDGHVVRHAASGTEALGILGERLPQLVLLDVGLRDGTGVELAETIHSRHADVPLVFLTKSAQEASDLPSWAAGGVLTKSTDLPELRRRVVAALIAEKATPRAAVTAKSFPSSLAPTSPRAGHGPATQTAKDFSMRFLRSTFVKAAGAVLVGVLVLVGLAAANGAIRLPGSDREEADSPKNDPKDTTAPDTSSVELIQGKQHTLFVPPDVRDALGIRKDGVDLIAVAAKPTGTRPLVMPGSTALDPTRLFRLRARFAPSPSSAECVQIGQIEEDRRRTDSPMTVFREIRSGDKVRKGDLMAVFYSVDVGNAKNNLVDAIYQLKLDDVITKRWQKESAVVPEINIWTQERTVVGDINAIDRTVSTLRAWGIPEQDIQALRKQAEAVKPEDAEKRLRLRDKSDFDKWARVEIRCPADGIVIERNVTLHEVVVDNTTNLFQVADLGKLFVTANCQEDELPQLEALRESSHDLIPWTVTTVCAPPMKGFIDDISYLIDPNQHTGVVKGYIDNKDAKLRGGQFISATVDLPPPPDVVELPVSAVIEDGQQTVVFVETDAAKQQYTMRCVELTNRFQYRVFVRSKPFERGEELSSEDAELRLLPKEPLRPGERVLQTGVNELKSVLLDRESRARVKAAEGK